MRLKCHRRRMAGPLAAWLPDCQTARLPGRQDGNVWSKCGANVVGRLSTGPRTTSASPPSHCPCNCKGLQNAAVFRGCKERKEKLSQGGSLLHNDDIPLRIWLRILTGDIVSLWWPPRPGISDVQNRFETPPKQSIEKWLEKEGELLDPVVLINRADQ